MMPGSWMRIDRKGTRKEIQRDRERIGREEERNKGSNKLRTELKNQTAGQHEDRKALKQSQKPQSGSIEPQEAKEQEGKGP